VPVHGLAGKIVFKMTYNASFGTLNSTQLNSTIMLYAVLYLWSMNCRDQLTC